MFIYCDMNTRDVVKLEKSVTKTGAESECFSDGEEIIKPSKKHAK